MRTLLCLLALLVLPAPVSAQVQLRGELARLGFMVGEWQGTGWVRYAPDGPQRAARVIARGAPMLSGMRLGWSSVATSTDRERAIVHNADLGVRFRADSSVFRAALDHGTTRVDGWVNPGTCEMAWGYTAPHDAQVLFRYTSRVEGTRRVEMGERSADGGSTWWAFYGAELTGTAVDGCPASAPATIL
ncbi:hypothetical protein [Longimicrobium sp.]|uniref:hypothetical protein n=1 Tax=Longimicrobium sp. TaxID=2029185 RepID=UPI002E3284BC|nr:hypothetical protein [Longimicrobium sp.]HEX6040989.1 hypothetical protein [Longimicrobium sp.]